MKKAIRFILFMFLIIWTLAACNNAGETVETKDSTNLDVNTRTGDIKDTASYERMPNQMTDSTQH